jgi:hypothetical protein
MVSAHLYEMDDLGATLLLALRTVDPLLATQITKELTDSNEHEYLQRLLLFAWYLRPPDPIVDASFARAVATEDLLFLHLMFPICDPYPDRYEPHTIPTPKASKTPAPSSWTNLPSIYTSEQAHTLYRAIKYALKQQYWEHAAYLVCSLLPDHHESVCSLLRSLSVDERLVTLLESTTYSPLLPRIVEHIIAAYVGNPEPVQKSHALLQRLHVKSPHENRKCRTFHIPQKVFEIWNLKPKLADRLRGSPVLVLEDTTSAYWKQAAAKYKIALDSAGNLCFPDDAAIEDFYTTYFPDDIPDEWSEQERQKSHGQPCIPAANKNPWSAAFHLIS